MYKTAQPNTAEGTENLTDKNMDLKRIEKITPTWKAAKEEKNICRQTSGIRSIFYFMIFLSSLFATLIFILNFLPSINSGTIWENEHFHCD